MRVRLIVSTAALLAACDHGWPFQPGQHTPDGPLDPSPPVRLTLNLGDDRTPSWLPDGSGVVYTRERLDRDDTDHCLAIQPADGGPIVRQMCHNTGGGLDSVDALVSPAVRDDGTLAYVRWTGRLIPARSVAPDRMAIMLATLDAPAPGRVLRIVPYVAPPPSDTLHRAIQDLQWLDDSTLIYVASGIAYPDSRDTLIWGLEIATLTIGAAPTVQVIPGTAGASSVAVSATGDTIYYTLNGDSRVFRRSLVGAQIDTVHDFGAIARDVAVRGSRLFAIVGGDVIFELDAALGLVQRDNGGTLQRLDMQTGQVTDSLLVLARNPAVSPDGRAVVAQIRSGRPHELWLVTAP